MRALVQSMARLSLPLMTIALALTLVAAPSSAAAEQPARTPAVDHVASENEPGEDFSAASSDVQQDLAALSRVQDSARARLDQAKEEADRVAAEMERNEKAVAKARQLVSVYMRSIYISGPTELTMLASVIDTDDLGDLLKQAEIALRVGDHKDDQFQKAVDLLKRTEAAKEASDASLSVAKDSLAAVDDQLNGLRQRRADIAGDLAGRVKTSGSVLDPEQAQRNTDAALAWADYLDKLARLRVPPVTADQLNNDQLPAGLSKSKKQAGVAIFRKGKKRVVVLPERTIAAVTYAVALMGSDYRWKANTATELDCSALVDRAWNVPSLPAEERMEDRALVDGGVRGLAKETRLVSPSDRQVGDLLFLEDAGAGVNHVGIEVTDDLMIASDSTTGAVNALPITKKRVWKAGRAILPAPKRANSVPKSTKTAFQCGADPDTLISLPDGKTLGNVKLCPPAPGVFSESNMQPSAILAGRCIARTWPQIPTIGGFRSFDSYPDHPSGRALDVMMPGGCSLDEADVRLGDSIAEFFVNNSDKFNVEYMIWRQRIWNNGRDPKQAPADWRTMGDRGDCTSNHMDHIHLTLKGPNVNPSQGDDSGSEDGAGD